MKSRGFLFWTLHLYLIGYLLVPDFIRHELPQVQALIRHYQHHTREENESIGFIDFLQMHYGENNSHTSQEDHQDLPLFHHGACSCLVFVHESGLNSPDLPEFVVLNSTIDNPNHYHFSPIQNVFQPPKGLA